MLLYAAHIYENLIGKDAIYLEKLLKIPHPIFVVFYNGDNAYPDHVRLRISDAFKVTPEVFQKNPKKTTDIILNNNDIPLEVKKKYIRDC
jgi:hypothetical protein